MARIRRPKKITGSEYTFGGGGGGAGSGDVVRFMRYSDNAVENGGTGVLHNPGTKTFFSPIKVVLEAGLSVSSANQTISRLYWDHAFEAPSNVGAVLVTEADELPSGVGSTVPSGLSVNTNTDSTDSDTGNIYFSGTISSSVEAGTYKFRYRVSQQGWTVNYIDYELEVWPQGTTPTQASTSLTTNRIIKEVAEPQYLTGTITGTQIVAYTVKDVSGFGAGVVPKVDQTDGRVYVENTPALDLTAVAHSFTVEVDLGQYGKMEYAYSGQIAYGGPYGARYWGPGNSYRNWSDGNYEGSGNAQQQDGTYWFAPAITTGAIKCTDRNRDTSPYGQNDGYGLNYSFSSSAGANNINSTSGSLCSYTNGWYIGNNDAGLRFKWTVPAGVTSFCVVGISGGCHGGQSWANDGGGSGALAYVNNVTCSPGEDFIIRIGMGRQVTGQSSYWAGDTYMYRASNNEYILYCYGAGYYSRQSNIGIGAWSQYSYDNNQRNPGAAAASSSYGTYAAYYGGWSTSYSHGAGTAGYRGTGQGGSNSGSSSNGGARNGRGYSSTYGGSAGGGTGLDGNGVGCQYNGYSYGSGCEQSDTNTQYGAGQAGWRYGGSGGSGGSRGVYGENPYTGSGYGNQQMQGGTHGGGGGGAGTSWGSGPGGPGGLRVIWGEGRAFPNTYTTENPTITNQS